jgi:hypothetical protein
MAIAAVAGDYVCFVDARKAYMQGDVVGGMAGLQASVLAGRGNGVGLRECFRGR